MFDRGVGAHEISTQAARSRKLLEAIEETISSLGDASEILAAQDKTLRKITTALSAARVDRPIDPNDEIVDGFNAAIEATHKLGGRFAMKREAAQSAEELREDDGVVESYDEAIEALSHLQAAMFELVDAIVLHDAPYQETVPFTSAEDFPCLAEEMTGRHFPAIKSVALAPRAVKQAKRLQPDLQAALASLLQDLTCDPPGTARRFHLVNGIWKADLLKRAWQVAFTVDSEIATLQYIGPHDHVDRYIANPPSD